MYLGWVFSISVNKPYKMQYELQTFWCLNPSIIISSRPKPETGELLDFSGREKPTNYFQWKKSMLIL